MILDIVLPPAYIHAELPLGDPAVAECVESLEGIGFSFAGLVPELANGDILRLHYLTNVELDLKFATKYWPRPVRASRKPEESLQSGNFRIIHTGSASAPPSKVALHT